jgi:hypothetical protein
MCIYIYYIPIYCEYPSTHLCSVHIHGNIYVVDKQNKWIRRIDAVSGVVSNITNRKPFLEEIIDVQVNSAGIVYALTPTQLYSINPFPSYYVVGSHTSIENATTYTSDSTLITLSNTTNTIYLRG